MLIGGGPRKGLDFDNKTLLDGTRYSHPQNVLWVSKLFTSSDKGSKSLEENKINKINPTEVLKIGLYLPNSLELQRLFFPLFIHGAVSGVENTWCFLPSGGMTTQVPCLEVTPSMSTALVIIIIHTC